MKDTLIAIFAPLGQLPLALAIGILLAYTIYLHFRIRKLTKGSSAASLEEVIRTTLDNALAIQKENEEIRNHAITLDKRLSQALRNAQTLRYKAFETGGSNQSFSVALINEQGSGLVLTSLHARDRISTFAKPVERYESTYELTDEERQVIEDSKKAHRR
jgi:hypothetical protein